MPDFTEVFADCRTDLEVDAAYKEAYVESPLVHDPQDIDDLAEAARRAHVRIADLREGRTSDDAPDTEDKIGRGVIRNWAMQTGIPLGKNSRVTKDAENAYRVAHNLPSLPGTKDPVATLADANASSKEIRAWAKENGVEVGARGRVHPDIIAKYITAHTA